MNRTVCFNAEQPPFVHKGEERLAGAGDDKLGNECKAVTHSQTGSLQVGLGFVICGSHTQNQVNLLLGISFD